MKLLAFVLLVALCGCSQDPVMSNEQIIGESKKCTDAGLRAEPLHQGWDARIVHIQCVPKLESK